MRFTSKLAAPLELAVQAQPVQAASVTYDFGYRLERAIDPTKRGPATGGIDDADGEDGSLMLDAMCNPPMPQQPVEPNIAADPHDLPIAGASSAAADTMEMSPAAAAANLGVQVPVDLTPTTGITFGVLDQLETAGELLRTVLHLRGGGSGWRSWRCGPGRVG